MVVEKRCRSHKKRFSRTTVVQGFPPWILTYRHPQKAEAQDLKSEARRVISPDKVHLGALPLDDAGLEHVVRNGL